jgi:hypothetical protein
MPAADKIFVVWTTKCPSGIIKRIMPTEVTRSYFEVPPKPFNGWDYLLCLVAYFLIGIALEPGIAVRIVSAW